MTDDEILALAVKHKLGRTLKPIGLDTGDVFYTDASYRTAEILDFARELLAHAVKGTPDLHAAIMNLPSKWTPDDGDEQAYKRGHRDARHAAAELAAGVPAVQPPEHWVADLDALSRAADEFDSIAEDNDSHGNNSAAESARARAYELRQVITRGLNRTHGVAIPQNGQEKNDG